MNSFEKEIFDTIDETMCIPVDGVLYISPDKTRIERQEYTDLPGVYSCVAFPPELTSIGYSAFALTYIIDLILPPKLENIGVKAFYRCMIFNVKIPNSVTYIDLLAFARNTCLTSVIFGPESQLRTIGRSSFMSCPSLTHIVFPPYLEDIEEYAFAYSGLKYIVISVNIVRNFAFTDCKGLQEVVFKRPRKPAYCRNMCILDSVFTGCTALKKLIFQADDVYINTKNVISSCTDVVWVIYQEEFGYNYKEGLEYKNKEYKFIFPNAKHTIVWEKQLENLEYFLSVSDNIDVHNWDFLSLKVYEYLENIL